MSSDLLVKIEKAIRKIIKSEDPIIANLLLFFKYYKKDMWLYPGILKRKFGLKIVDAYSLLKSLELEGILAGYYELYCCHCQKSNGIVHTFNELPVTFHCELCNEELNTLENAVLIYKVIKNE